MLPNYAFLYQRVEDELVIYYSYRLIRSHAHAAGVFLVLSSIPGVHCAC